MTFCVQNIDIRPVCNALSLNKLDSVFTVIKDENFIIYKDHKNLSSKKFKKITDELYNCSKIQYDKECYKYLIAFIQKNNLKDKVEKIKDKIIFD